MQSAEQSETQEPRLPVRVAAVLTLAPVNIFLTLLAAIVLGAAGVFLTTAWLYGPKILIDRAQYKRFTAHANARIVESWIALELEQSTVKSPRFWRASAHATPCVVVETAPEIQASSEWNIPVRRAFCGTRLKFGTGYTLADVRELAPGVPFSWHKDSHGYAVPEIRVDPATRTWLAAHPAHTFMHSDWPATNELEWLILDLDRPVDEAIAGWSAPPPIVPLLVDPAHAEEPMPAGIIRSRLSVRPNGLAIIALGGIGLFLWVVGFSLIPQLAGLAPLWRWFVVVLPLLTLPTWIDTFPTFLAPMSAQWTAVVSDMLGDLNPLDRMQASEPGAALLASGARLQWSATAGAYADTFGRVAPDGPPAPVRDADTALRALSDAIAARVRALAIRSARRFICGPSARQAPRSQGRGHRLSRRRTRAPRRCQWHTRRPRGAPLPRRMVRIAGRAGRSTRPRIFRPPSIGRCTRARP